MKPRLLDLFCGAGGAAMGYHRAGFEVVGVDIAPQPRYPFTFIQGDALAFFDDVVRVRFRNVFDAIHASPPCQAFVPLSNKHRGKGGTADQRVDLITPVRPLLEQTGLPYVIENVEGAVAALRDPYRLTGEMVGLATSRPRYFETNWPLMVPKPPPRQKDAVAVYGRADGRRLFTRADGSELRAWRSIDEGRDALGVPWMETALEIREAIPPAYTELVGHQLKQHVTRRAA